MESITVNMKDATKTILWPSNEKNLLEKVFSPVAFNSSEVQKINSKILLIQTNKFFVYPF